MSTMSESDSDLDYESADEISAFDQHEYTKNNNHNAENKPLVQIKKKESITICKSSGMEPCVSGSHEEIPNINVLEERMKLNAMHITEEDRNANETKPESVEKSSVVEQIKNVVSEKPESTVVETSHDKANQSRVKTDSNRPEKQRITLRLEKKIQQKNQLPKESSIEKNLDVSSENSFKKSESKSSWGFGSWGSNLLSTAASSVSTFTNQVSQGIGSVLETVETTIGAPSPEELAVSFNKVKESDEYEKSPEKDAEDESVNTVEKDENIHEIKSSMLPNVSSWTKVLENTGSKVLMGGLDTLELIGKKTFDIITEGDPGLRKKRAAFSNGITLSQILREAKAEADESKQIEDSEGVGVVHYSQMFDEYQGLVHLEALEMLSKQSQVKIQRLLMRLGRSAEIRKSMEEIKSICESTLALDDPADCEDFEDFVTVCKKHVLELNLAFNVDNIIKTQKRISDVVKSYENVTPTTSTPEEIYHSAICSLAEFTAKAMEIFHKLAELILVQKALEPSVEYFATNLTGLTTVMCIEINNLSARYHRCLESLAEQSENGTSEKFNVTNTVTNLYLEASNSNKYIQDAFLLLVPVLQVSLLESS